MNAAGKRIRLGWVALCLLLTTTTTWAMEQELVCQVRVGSDTRWLHQKPSTDPYVTQSIDMGERMRFRAVVLGQPDRIEHITLSVYELDLGDAPVILQQSRLSAPFNAQAEVPSLTGWNLVYAHHLGRELRYGCALQPVAPSVSGAQP